MEKKISIYKGTADYPDKNDLFRPDTDYPEYFFHGDVSPKVNHVYQMVREALRLMDLDSKNFGLQSWNPLSEFVKPGDSVLIKPNLVMHRNLSGDSTDCLYTNPAVIAAVIDYVVIALKGDGKIVVGDAPMQECDFQKLLDQSGLEDLIQYYKQKNIDIQVVDFRELTSTVKNGIHVQSINTNAKGKVIDLAKDSEFDVCSEKQIDNLRITNYDPTELKKHHSFGKHEYYISDYVLNADVIINVPKPKTHRKAGVTISLKNLVGVNVRKEFLPHHCMGSKSSGGDEYLKTNKFKIVEAKILDSINYNAAHKKYKKAQLLRIIKKVNSIFIRFSSDKYREGSWYGNNTISKTVADINKIVLYSDKQGKLCETKQRKYLIVADMVVSGECEGPVMPSRKEVGAIAVGSDPVCFDEAIATLMGMDISRIPVLRQARTIGGKYTLTESDSNAYIVSNVAEWDSRKPSDISNQNTLHFKPTSGWKGFIEKK